MDFTGFIERFGEGGAGFFIGLGVGALFGAFAQQSRFCLRSAALEFAHGSIGGKVAVWLLAFSAAVLGTALLGYFGLADLAEARQLASPQSLSGALVGGLMFGAGMVLARGCSSRLLVLAATGNLRSLLSGLVFAVVAQASLHGFFSSMRESIAGWLTTDDVGGNDLLALFGAGWAGAVAFAAVWLAAGLFFAWRASTGWRIAGSALIAGTAIPLAWYLTSSLAGQAFEPVQVESLTFTGPSADTLMSVLMPLSEIKPDFDVGLVPGVFLGSFLAAALTRELALQGFEGGKSMRRYLAGAALMGFGGMLAGGCAVGAGVTGASVFALTAWITLSAIWFAAAVTDWLVDRPAADAAVPASGAPAGPGRA